MNSSKHMKALINELNAASKAYYETGRTIMDDAEFDIKLDQLKELEKKTGVVLSNSPTHNVGYVITNKINKEELDHPMLSLDKCHSVDEIISFLGGKRGCMSIKLDGNSITARYENGKLVGLHSRGNGTIGNDLMVHAASFKNLPLIIPIKGTFVVDGEAIITKDEFENINAKLPDDEKFANSRNLVAGTLSLLDSKISAERSLKFIAWNLIQADNITNDYVDNLLICKLQGFDVVPGKRIAEELYNETDIQTELNTLRTLAQQYQYPMDGAVITFTNITYGKSLGRTEKFFRHSIAYKYDDEIAETTLTGIEWSVGKTKITPVAHFKPVIIDGTEISKASLHNVSIFKKFKLGVEDKITVYKANCIIPQIKENFTQSNTCTIPSICPHCGSPTKIDCQNSSEELICTNVNCSAKLINHFKHFCSRNAINIEGLSEATLQKLIDANIISCFRDIFYLNDYYSTLIKFEGFGEKSVNKLLNSIDKSRNTTLSRFIYSLSIPLIGETASKQIEKYCDCNLQKFIDHITKNKDKSFLNIQGFGTEMAQSINNYWNQHAATILELAREFKFETHDNTLNSNPTLLGNTFCITGNVEHFKNRNELKEIIENSGGKVSSSVTSKTNYLINNDSNSNSSKNKKAKELNIPIITEEEFMQLMKGE